MRDGIKVGDSVDVFWEHIEPLFKAEVISIPCATGDCWILRATDGTINYVQSFAKIVKL